MYEKKALMLRLPPELHTKVVTRAEKAGLSLNQWVVLALASSLDGDPTPVTITQTTVYEV